MYSLGHFSSEVTGIQIHFCSLESEYIKFLAMESESNYLLGELVMGPNLHSQSKQTLQAT